jgi:hypothetical protein
MDERDLIHRITLLEERLKKLENSTTIPFEVEQAFRDRLRISSYSTIESDSKSASSENQAVNEGGSATYSVLKSPDRFVKVVINGQNRYLPAYD